MSKETYLTIVIARDSGKIITSIIYPKGGMARHWPTPDDLLKMAIVSIAKQMTDHAPVVVVWEDE